MPKNKFDAFYYGVGMKLDEASVDEVGKKLEGRLNKVVDNVTKNLTTISEAVTKGVKDVDTKELVKSLVDAQRELNQFQNFDPSKLQKQIDSLNTTVASLSESLGDVGAQLKTFTDDVTSRLSNIEIKTSKQGKDALKADLREMKTLAQGFSNILASGEKVDTSSLDRYFQKVKAGFASLKASGNPMELFADKELANYFVDLTNILRKMGDPVDDLRADFFELSSTFKGFFTKSNASGAQNIFDNIGYKIESTTSKLRKAKAELADYEAQITKQQARANTTGFDITIDGDKDLNFEQKIKRIQEYGDIAAELDYGEEWAVATRHQIALIQAAEKELEGALKTTVGEDMLKQWQKAFGGYDLKEKLSTSFISDYVAVAQDELNRLQAIHSQTQENIKKFKEDIGRLQATEKATTSKGDKQTSRSTTQKQKASGIATEIEAKIKINETEWVKTINAALKNIESKNKVKPFKIKVEATQGKILEEIKKIKEATLMDKKNNGDKDVVSFNNNFEKFINNLKSRKQELINELKQNWHPALKDAFSFRMELLGIDEKSMTKNISTYILSTVDAINTMMESKPIEFRSNIDALIEEVKSKFQDIEIDIGTKNINVNSEGLSNANIIINGIVGGGNYIPQTVPPSEPLTTQFETPAAPTSTDAPSKQSVDVRKILQNLKIPDISKFTKWEEIKPILDKYKDKLKDGAEGTEEYITAQATLVKLISAWSTKLGKASGNKAPQVPGMYSKPDVREEYFKRHGLITEENRKHIPLSMSAFKKIYDIDDAKPKVATKKVQDAEEQMANEYAAGKAIIEYYLKLAKWAKALSPIAEGVDHTLTEDDFKEHSVINRNGKLYDKNDIGKVVPGRKLSFEDLDAFIAEYEQSESEEDKQLFGFLKKVIDAYKLNQQRLDSFLNEFSDSDIVGGYEFADNKTKFLTTSMVNMLRGFAPMKKAEKQLDGMPTVYEFSAAPKTKAGVAVQDALKNVKDFEFLIGQLYNTSDANEQWEIIQKIIPELLSNLKKRESATGRPTGKNYTQLEELLQLIQAYTPMHNSLQVVGQEAANLMRGSKAPEDAYRKEWDSQNNRWYTTNEKIGVKQSLITEGLRQEIGKLAVVFIDKLGNAIAGFGAGKGVVNDKNYLSGASASYSKIVTFLTNALNQAAQIAIDTNRRGMKGYTNVTKWTTPSQTNISEQPYEFTVAETEKSKIEGEIKKLNATKTSLEQQLAQLTQQLNNTTSSSDSLQKTTSLISNTSQKKSELDSINQNIRNTSYEIEILQKSLDNPSRSYEDITAKIIAKEEELLKLRAELAKKKKNVKNGVYDKEIEDLQTEIDNRKHSIDSLQSDARFAGGDVDNSKASKIIEQEEKKLQALRDKNPEAINKIYALREEIKTLEKNARQSKDRDSQKKIIESKRNEVNELLKSDEELSRIIEEMAMREKYIAQLKGASNRRKNQTPEEINNQINGKLQALEKMQTEQAQLEAELSTLKTEEDKIVAQEVAHLQNKKQLAQNRLKTINGELGKGNSADSTRLQEEKNNLENEILSLDKEIELWNSKRIFETIASLQQEIQSLQARISNIREQTSNYTKNLNTAKNKVKYNKSYDRAISDLPHAKTNKERAEQNLADFRLGYDAEQLSFLADIMAKQTSGAITAEESDALIKSIPKIGELNQKLIEGKISYQDYLQTIENAYVLMRQATTDEAKASAKADAKRLADATLLVQKYREEVDILEEIIKTQKPKETTSAPSTESSNKQSKNPSPTPSQPLTNKGFSATDAGVALGGTATGGNIVLGNLVGATGLATEGTVDKIYRLLSVKKDSGIDSRIEEIKNAIAIKEEENRVKAAEAKAKADAEAKVKADAEVKARAEAEAKAKVEAEAKAADARKKYEENKAKAQAEAEKKKTEETKKQVENEKKKTEESKKQSENEKKKTTENKNVIGKEKAKSNTTQTSKDALLGALGKSKDDFWKSYLATSQEVKLGQRVFREHSIKLKKDSVTGIVRGLMARSPGLDTGNLDTYGHLHPADELYSAADFKGMKVRREKNASYNTDFLLTPNYIYKLNDLKNASIEALEEIRQQFEKAENVSLPQPLLETVKESYLHYFSQQNGSQFSKMAINPDNTVTDITQQISVFSKDVLDKIIKLGELNQQIQQKLRDKQSNTDEYRNTVAQRDALKDELHKDELYDRIAPKGSSGFIELAKIRNAQTQSHIDATLIQEAVDFDFDLSLFVDTFKDFFAQMQNLGKVIPSGSPLEKIKTYIDDISNLPVDSLDRKKLIDQIKPYVFDVFKKNDAPKIDTRDVLLNPLKEIAKLDTSGQINRAIQKFAPATSTDNSNMDFVGLDADDDIMSHTIQELKTELARLIELRDNGEVDPRFATAEKQDVIINLLKNGIKISGKTDKTSGGSGGNDNKTRTPQMPNVSKANMQAEEINKLTNINKDSSLYKQYIETKELLDEAIASATAKGKDRTKDDTDQIRTLLKDVTNLGKQIIKTSESFEQFKERGGKSFAETITDVDSLKNKMMELASENALSSKMLLRDVAYDDVTQKMTYNLVDLEGNITRVTMAYNDLLGAILTTSSKTTNSASKIYGDIEGEMINRIGVNDAVSVTPTLEQSSQYQLYINAYNAMMDAQDTLRAKGEMATKEERDSLISLTNTVVNTRSEFEKLVKASTDFNTKVEGDTKDWLPDIDLSDQMKRFVLTSHDWTASQREMIEQTWNFKDAQKEANYSVVNGNKQLLSMTVIADEGTRQIGQYTLETKKYQTGMEKFMTSLKGKWQEVARYLMSFGSLYRVWGTLRQGVQYVREIDSALTELKKVTNETEESYDRFLQTAAKTADKVGSTIKEIVSSTADWSRLGYSMEEAAKLAESTSILLNVSEFQSIDDATSALTSTLQAFSYTAKDSMNVVDVLNEVGNNFAISSDGIATALKDSASSLMAANNSYQEAVSLIAAANRVVQDPNSVGAALRTISLRLRGTSTEELAEAGEDTTGVVTSKSKLRTKIQGYTGIDILTDSGAYKSTYEILLEISKVWDDLTDQDRAGLLELIAGKTRSNTAAAILSNTKDLEEAYKSAMDAEGSALRENEKYLDSIQGRIDLFNNSVQTMWSNTLDSNIIKGVVNIGTQLVKWVDNLGLIQTLIMGIGTYLIQRHFKGDLLGGLFGGSSTQTVADIKAYIQTLKTEYEKAQAAFDANHSRDNEKYLNRTKNKYEQYKNHFEPQIKEYDELENKILSLKETRQSLLEDFDKATVRQTNDIPIIDQEIDGVQRKLDAAKQQLKEIKSADWDYYKKLGSKTPAKDRDNRIDIKTQEVKQYEKALHDLQIRKQELEASPNRLDEEINKIDDEIKALELNLNKIGNTGLTAFQKIKMGAKSAIKSIWEFSKQMIASMATMYVITTIAELIMGLGQQLAWVHDQFVETPEEAQDKFEELNEELSKVQSELDSLNSELETTQERIDELLSQGTLSFTEQEELDRLRAENDELERKIKLNKTLEESKQKSVNSAAVNATDKYLSGTSFASDVDRTEKQETWKKNGEALGKAAGIAAGPALAAALAKIGGGIGTFFGGPIGTIAGMAIGSIIGGLVVGTVGSGLAGASYDSEESVGEAMDNMLANRDKLLKAQNEAMADSDVEAYNEATQALTTYDEQMAKHISQIQANYNAMDWSTATDEQKKKMMEYADWLDRYSISIGTTGAKSSAIERIFGGAEASKELKNIDKQIKNAMKSGEDIDFYEMFNSEGLAETKQRLNELGITITDLKYYYLDWKEAEEEVEGNTYETVKAVGDLTDGIGALKDAFSEFQEEGLATADTLTNLYDTFGTLGDAWDNYVDVMATGTSSTQEARKATEELLEAFVNQRLNQGPIKDMREYLALIGQLQNLGVDNAAGYVNALQKASMASSIAKDVVNQEKELAKLEEKKNNDEITEEEYNEKKTNLQKTKEDFIKQYEEEYSMINLSDEEKKSLVDKAIAAETAKQAAADAQIKDNEYKIAIKEQGKASDKLIEAQQNLEDFKKTFNPDEWEYAGAGTYRNPWTGDTMYESDYNQSLSTLADLEDEVFNAQRELDDINVALPINPEIDVDAAEQEAKDAEEAYQEELDKLGLTIQIELYESNQAVDDIQSVFDTLSDAVKEFNENGYLSVDTVQGLLGNDIDSKYLTLLQDENGQLQLNKEALIDLAKARMMDLGVKKATNLIESMENALKNDSIDKAKELTEVTYGLTNSTWDFVESEAARVAILMREKGMTESQVNSFLNQISAIKQLTNSAVNDMADAISTSGNGATDSALESIQKRYERKIKNLENQQTQIENEIEILEAKEAGVSADYYDKEIAIEEKKKALYEQQRTELLKLKRTDEVADALWEVEHAIQESTLRLIEFRKAIAELYATASDNLSEAYDNKGQVYDDRKSFIENEISIRETKGELVPTSVYDELIEQEELARKNAQAELDNQEALYLQGIQNNPKEFENSDEAIAILEKIRQEKLNIQGHDKAIAEYAEQQKDAYIAYFDAMMEAYSHRNDLIQAQADLGQSYIDRLEVLNINVPDEAYKKMAEIQELSNESLREQAEFARGELDDMKAQGIAETDSRYIEKFKEVLNLEQQVYEGETKVLEYHQQIIDNQIDRFNQVIDRINHEISQLDNISSLVDGKDVAEKDGSWTAAGLTQLGINYQTMEYNKGLIDDYAAEMAYLDAQLEAGQISEKEYTEQMQELENGQWDAIKAYKSAEDAIIDLNEARIDMVEQGLQEEIEAYQELIDIKKEELDAERDLYDFRKDVQKQTKDIAALERRIASMSGSTDAATIAERTRLEKDLREAREGLDDTYYNHAMDSQSKALDDEVEAFTKSAEDYIESLRESIKDTGRIIEETFLEVLGNADLVLGEIDRLAEEYGFTIEPSLRDPWVNAAGAAEGFKNTADPSIRSLINDGGAISIFGSEETKNKLAGVFGAGSGAASQFATDVGTHMTTVKNTVNQYTTDGEDDLGKKLKAPWDDAGNDEDSGPLAFSKKTEGVMSGVVEYAKTNYQTQLKNSLNYPWDSETGANDYKSWGKGVTTMLDGVISKAQTAATEISKATNFEPSNYEATSGAGGGGGGGKLASAAVKTLQKFLNQYWNSYVYQATGSSQLAVDGSYGSKTTATVKAIQKKIGVRDVNGLYDYETAHAMAVYWQNEKKKMSQYSSSVAYYNNAISAIPPAMYAKGTLGTTRDQWAVTDESWIGEEITLAAGKNGQLQYLKKGSAVMPADISANLVEWGKLNPNMMDMNVGAGVNLMSNYVSKPEVSLSFDSLVHVDHCDQGTLKDLEKMVDTKINQFGKQLNYAIKQFK